MNIAKCTLHNEGEKTFVDFEFNNLSDAREFFQSQELIQDIIDALGERPKTKEETKETKDFGSTREQAKANLAETLRKLPKDMVKDLAELLQEVSNKEQ